MRNTPGSLLDDLRSRTVEMGLPVRWIVVLVRVEIGPRIGIVDLLDPSHGAIRGRSGIGKYDLRTVGHQNPLTFHRGIRRQAKFDLVSARGRDHRVSNSR